MASSSKSNKRSRVTKDMVFPEKGSDDSSNPEGKFQYNHYKMIKEFVKCLNLDNLPLETFDRDDFEEFVQLNLQPAFKKVPLKKLVFETVVSYLNAQQSLRLYFMFFKSAVSVSTELWSSKWGERFLCVTCHWIDESWIKQNRVLAFRVISDDASSVEICGKIIKILDGFDLRKHKIFSISLGKTFDSYDCVDYLDNELKPFVRDFFVYDRSCGYVANLCAQHGMEQLGSLIDPIRALIRWIRRFDFDHGRLFKRECEEAGLKPRYFPLDCATSWKTTFEMLSIVFPYKDIVTKMYKEYNAGELDFQWDSIESIIKLFGNFDHAIRTFSLVYEPICHLVLQEWIHIVRALRAHENDPLLGLVVRSMKNKWLQHLSDGVPTIYCIGTILDPRMKHEGLSCLLLEYHYETLGLGGDTYCIKEKALRCKRRLYGLYTFFPFRMTTSKKGDEISKKKRVVVDQGITELDEYLLDEHVVPKDFDICQWWKTKEEVFPVLSRLARHVLCTPVSIDALESAFSTGEGERVLDEQWSMLQPSGIQACICKRDWDRAEKRAQCYNPTIDGDNQYMDPSSNSDFLSYMVLQEPKTQN